MAKLRDFAWRWRATPTLAFTHFQPAQLTTVGKRATLWLHDLLLDYRDLVFRESQLALLGVKGATGTQASFLNLFGGDEAKVHRLEQLVAEKVGMRRSYPVSGQTYSRKVDSQVVNVLAGFAQSASKFGYDMRLLQHLREIEEPFEEEQIGSSAMPYKRNPDARGADRRADAAPDREHAQSRAHRGHAVVRADARRLRESPHRHPRGVPGRGCGRADLRQHRRPGWSCTRTSSPRTSAASCRS